MNEVVKKAPVNWDRLDVGIEHSGRAITLPADPEKMPLEKAINALVRKHQDEMQDFNLHEIIDAFPYDGVVAFVKAMQKLYGWASPIPTPGFFGPKPPQMLSVKTGWRNEDVLQCPFGSFKLPGVNNPVQTSFTTDDEGRNCLVIHGTFQKRERHILLELATETRRIVAAESIYRGKAIRLKVDDGGDLLLNSAPEFLNVEDTSEADLIFDHNIQAQIDTSILVPIKHTSACRKNKIPLKRGILLEGAYGTGKSLTARMTANVCERNGWTFVLLDKVQGLRAALEFAKRYAPAVVFAEDIDRIMMERDEDANDLINTIDGVVSKNSEIMTILTTNHVDKIQPVILRPGRLDAVISLKAPTQEAVARLLRAYAGNLLPLGSSVDDASVELSGQIPATIRECVERAKLGMIGRGDVVLNDSDLTTAAQTMKAHLALLNRNTAKETDAEGLARTLRAVVVPTSADSRQLADIHQEASEANQNADLAYRNAREIKRTIEQMATRKN